MATSIFYPPITSLINLKSLPEQLDFLGDALETLLSNLFYRNLQALTSESGESGFYSLTLILYETLRVEIPGTGLALRINYPAPGSPNPQDPDHTEINCSVRYQWNILKYLNDFSLDEFDFSPSAIERTLSRIVNETVDVLISGAIETFVEKPITAGGVADFIDLLNQNLAIPSSYELTLPSGSVPEMIEDIARQIETNVNLLNRGIDLYRAIFEGVIAPSENVLDALVRYYKNWFSIEPTDFLNDLLVPKIHAELGLSIQLEFSPDLLTRVTDPPGLQPIENEKAVLHFDVGDLIFDTQEGIRFREGIYGTLLLSRIGESDFYISIERATLDLSTTSNIPEAAAAGLPLSFVGAYVEEVTIIYPQFWTSDENETDTASLIAENMFIGTGGVTGRIRMEADGPDDPLIYIRWGDFAVAIDSFFLDFYQSHITGSSITGSLTIPGIFGGDPATVGISVTITDAGFEVTAYPNGLVLGCNDPNAANCIGYTVGTLSIGNEGDRYYLQTSGRLKIKTDLPVIGNLLSQELEIKKLRIWSDGKIDLEGGSLILPKAVSIKAGPIELTVTAIHIGTHERYLGGELRHYSYFGFDGGIKSGPGGVDVRGNGIKYYYTTDDGEFDHFLKIQGIAVDITIPGGATPEQATVIIQGFISLQNPSDEQIPEDPEAFKAIDEYAGGVQITIPKLEMAGGASIRVTPSTGDFLVDMNFEMSNPILLGATGLGIYGFRGLIGSGYVVSKNEGESWWEYYRRPKLGINQAKMARDGGFSLGAGASIATAQDSGRAFSSKLFFLASIPRLFLLEGQANIMSRRLGLDTTTDPPFYAALLISDESIEAGFGVNWRLPDGGEILDLDANLELAFFYKRMSAWYVNIGRDEPKEKRVQAKVLTLVEMYSYLMLSGEGIRAGAGAGWDFEKDFSIARIAFGVAVDVGGRLSFKPVQIGGFVHVAGYASLRVFGIGFRISVDARLDAEAPKPFIISGTFHVELGLPWPIPDIKVSLSFTWRGDGGLNLNEIGMIGTGHYELGSLSPAERLELYLKEGKHPAQGVHIMSNETFPVNYVNRVYNEDPANDNATIPLPGATGGDAWIDSFNSFIVPLDTYIDIEFTKGIRYEPRTVENIGGTNHTVIPTLAPTTDKAVSTELIPPRKGKSDQVKHEYIITDVRIKYWKPVSLGSADEGQGSWEDYRFEKLDSSMLEIVGGNLPESSWVGADPKAILRDRAKFGFWQMTDGNFVTKLRIFSRSPLEYAAKISPVDAGFPKTLFLCPPKPAPMECQNWVDQQGAVYTGSARVADRKLEFRIANQNGTVVEFPNIFGLIRSLRLGPNNSIEIYFSQPTTRVELKMTTLADGLTVSWYRGYAWAPPPPDDEDEEGGSSSGSDDGIDRWDIEPSAPSLPANQDPIWRKLRKMPGWLRDLCGGTFDLQSPAGADAAALLGEFRQTHIYLRQSIDLPEPTYEFGYQFQNASEWCTELEEVIEAIIAAWTGAAGLSPYLAPNVEHFYVDMGRIVEDYRSTVGVEGTPDQTADAFYEKWTGLIEYLGRLYDARSSLASRTQGVIRRILDPEISRLYNYALSIAGGAEFDLTLNPAYGRWEPRDQLLSIAGFFSMLSLYYPKILSEDATDLLDPYFARLERVYFGALALLSKTELDTVGDLPGCTVSAQIVAITNLLCTDPPDPNISPAIDEIETLVEDFEPTLTELLELFGWTYPPPSTPDFCASLRRALGLTITALSAYESIPFALRYRFDRFYAALNEQVREYRRDTLELPLPDLDEVADDFISKALEMFGCLCRLCRSTTDLSGVEGYLQSDIDPELEIVFGKVVEDLYGELESNADIILQTYGTAIPENPCDQISLLLGFFMGAFARCSLLPGDVNTLLRDFFPDFSGPYSTFATFLNTGNGGGSYRHCSMPTGTFCADRLPSFELVLGLWRRRGELPGPIYKKINEALRPIIGNLYRTTFNLPEPNQIPVPADRDILEWELEEIIRAFRHECLTGNDIDLSLQTALQPDLDDLDAGIAEMKTFPEFPDVDLYGTGGTSPCDMMNLLLLAYTDIALSQPGLPSIGWPSTDLVNVVEGFEGTLDEITATLGLSKVELDGIGLNYSAILGEVLRTLYIAYGSLNKLPIGVVVDIRRFIQDFLTAYMSFIVASPVVPAGSCAETAGMWIAPLLCLCNVCRYRGAVEEVDDEFDASTGLLQALRTACARVLLVADYLSMEIMPGRVTNTRCRKLRVVGNYFAIKGLNYSPITQTWIDDIFPNRAAMEEAFDAPELEGVRTNICFPEPGPYDPLMKRETKTKEELLRRLVYDNPAKPIDRVVIGPSSECSENPPAGWLNTYWTVLHNYVENQLIPAINAELAAAMSALSGLGPKPDSAEGVEYEDRIAELTDELTKANQFLAAIAVPPATSYDPCTTWLHEVCWLPTAAYNYNLGLPKPHDVRKSIYGMDISLRLMTQPIWRPNTTYAVHIETLEKVRGKEYRRYHTFGFRTAGPIGHFHDTGLPGAPVYRDDYQKLLDEDRAEQYKYATLKHYLDYTRSYPGPDGNIIGAKPLYHANALLRIFYTQDYLKSMFSPWKWENWEGENAPLNYLYCRLEVVIEDPAGDGDPIRRTFAWKKDKGAPKSESLRIFNNIMENVEIGGSHCVKVTPVEQPPSMGAGLPSDAPIALVPRKLYSVSLRSRFAELPYDANHNPDTPDLDSAGITRDVHRYVFQTSRYATFAEHINSYILSQESGNEAYALYDREIDQAAAVTLARDYVQGANQGSTEQLELTKNYALDYDRIVEGALQIRDLAQAETTEFTVLRDDNGDPIGILVRSSEPLNDPRLPLEELQAGLTATDSGGDLLVFFAKDAAAAFVTGAAMTLASGNVSLTFQYRLFDGEKYDVVREFNEMDEEVPVPSVTVVIAI